MILKMESLVSQSKNFRFKERKYSQKMNEEGIKVISINQYCKGAKMMRWQSKIRKELRKPWNLTLRVTGMKKDSSDYYSHLNTWKFPKVLVPGFSAQTHFALSLWFSTCKSMILCLQVYDSLLAWYSWDCW